jgi:hypothetical protein
VSPQTAPLALAQMARLALEQMVPQGLVQTAPQALQTAPQMVHLARENSRSMKNCNLTLPLNKHFYSYAPYIIPLNLKASIFI